MFYDMYIAYYYIISLLVDVEIDCFVIRSPDLSIVPL